MSKKVFFVISLICLLVPPGCSEMEDTQTGEEVNVTLNLTGDFLVDVSQEPITKASSDDLYAVNVYRGSGTNPSAYASGLFDDVSAMNVTLLSVYKYKFTCCLIKNGKLIMKHGKSFGSEEAGYGFPFQRGTGDNIRPTTVENEFKYSTSFSGLSAGGVHDSSVSTPTTSNAKLYALALRYYGEKSNYTPVHNGVVEIELKRVTFGVQFEVQGLREGSLVINFGDFISNKRIISNGIINKLIYTFEDPYECWNWAVTHSEDEPYSITPNLTFKYDNTYDRGTYLDIWDKSKTMAVTLKRNTLTTIKITVDPDLSGVIPTFTEEPLSEENVINIGVQGGSLIDTGVDPNE